MSATTAADTDPLSAFKQRLTQFADGRRGIRNPFVIVPVTPEIEYQTNIHLQSWIADESSLPTQATAQCLNLQVAMTQTDVYQLVVDLGDRLTPEDVTETMQDRLATEMVEELIHEIDAPGQQSHIVLLQSLGSLYPFARSSELLDELDRRNVRSTVGVVFPGRPLGGQLRFFNEDSRSYYPAHSIDKEIEADHLP